MSEDITKSPYEADRSIEEILGIDPDFLVGQTISGVKLEGQYQRVDALRLALGDGTAVRISHWASYAEDSSLEAEVVRDSFGAEIK